MTKLDVGVVGCYVFTDELVDYVLGEIYWGWEEGEFFGLLVKVVNWVRKEDGLAWTFDVKNYSLGYEANRLGRNNGGYFSLLGRWGIRFNLTNCDWDKFDGKVVSTKKVFYGYMIGTTGDDKGIFYS